MNIEPNQLLTWIDFNCCAEDRDVEEEDIKNGIMSIDERCLVKSVESYEIALENGIINELNLIK